VVGVGVVVAPKHVDGLGRGTLLGIVRQLLVPEVLLVDVDGVVLLDAALHDLQSQGEHGGEIHGINHTAVPSTHNHAINTHTHIHTHSHTLTH